MVNKYIIIPARLQSTRLPNKLLLKKGDLTVLDYAINNALKCCVHTNVILATDSLACKEIADQWKIRTILTKKQHENGTSRIREAADQLNLDQDDIIVNLQGDCVKIDPDAIEWCLNNTQYGIIKSCMYKTELDKACNIAHVKVVVDKYDRAMYFSRHNIPYDSPDLNVHIDIYSFTYGTLVRATSGFPVPYMFKGENFEQLKWLYEDIPMWMRHTRKAIHIDTAEDYNRWVNSSD